MRVHILEANSIFISLNELASIPITSSLFVHMFKPRWTYPVH